MLFPFLSFSFLYQIYLDLSVFVLVSGPPVHPKARGLNAVSQQAPRWSTNRWFYQRFDSDDPTHASSKTQIDSNPTDLSSHRFHINPTDFIDFIHAFNSNNINI